MVELRPETATLDEIQPERNWLASLGNLSTRRVYEGAVEDFMQFGAITGAGGFRAVTQAHVMAWREYLIRRGLRQGTVRYWLAALSSFFEYPRENNVVPSNPVSRVKRPKNYPSASKVQALDDDPEVQPDHNPVWKYIIY
jgi:site-specific recombinase XerD